MQEWYKDYVNQIKAYLDGFFRAPVAWQPLYEAMRYSLLSGGKRIRPVLTLEFCRVSGGEPQAALPFAAAVEIVHTYSLCHDDLPAMDDDDLRRGRPACHKQYGEALAILAGDALQSAAFRAILSADLPEDVRCRAGITLARCAGEDGMVAGQVLDLVAEQGVSGAPRPADVELIHQLKTAALIQAACVMGVLAGGGTETQITAATRFARALGSAFQIRDDILDCIGDEATLGKRIGSDVQSGKATYVMLYGIARAEEMLREQTALAKRALDAFADTEGLHWLCDWLLRREW